MNRHRVPEADDLPALIRTAFDALPGPDEERLAAVGKRLAQQTGTQKKTSRNRRHSWYWLWLLLAGGAATAAWWAGETWWPQSADESQPKQVMPAPAEPAAEEKEQVPSRRADAGEESAKSPAGEQHSPVIYKREGY